MATATETITLLDYGNAHADEGVVVFWTSVGSPLGEELPYGYESETFSSERRLDDLTGTVNEAGEWGWDGTGHPTDWQRNMILSVKAYRNKARWDRLVAEYESEV